MQASATCSAGDGLSCPAGHRWLRRGAPPQYNAARTPIGLALVAGAAIVLCLAGPAAGQAVGLSIYYQATYADGAVRDLPDVPTTNEGILRVVRIARVDEGAKGYEILSTGRRVISQVDQPRTFARDMEWNGRAWVARALPEDLLPPPSPPAPPQAVLEAIARVGGILEGKRLRLAEHDRALVEAEAALGKAKGTEDEPAALKSWQAQSLAREECRDTIVELRGILALLQGDMPATMPTEGLEPGKPGPFDRPEGQVERLAAGQVPESEMGVVRPIESKVVPPHQIQVWPLPPGRGLRSYRVMMAHGEAGQMGAFHYVAYADTEGDGLPDELIAYSPLAVAESPGGWTGWTFSTAHGRVFVGNAWQQRDACIFARPLEDHRDNWRGLGTDVYVSGDLWHLPRHRCRWPYLSNIRVQVADQNPE